MLSYLGDVIVNGRPDVKGKFDPEAAGRAGAADRSRRARCPRRPACGRSCRSSGPERFAAVGARRAPAAHHRHDDARRASVAAGHARAHLRHARGRRRGCAPDAGSLQPRDVGRRDLRHVDALPAGRPVGAARRAAAADSEHPLPDAAARAATPSATPNYPDNVVRAFVKRSAAAGIDVFRIFDSLNWVAEHAGRRSRRSGRTRNAICEAAICYTGDILDPDAHESTA